MRCVNDTNGDGDCAACARNPDALCRVKFVAVAMTNEYGERTVRESGDGDAALSLLVGLVQEEMVRRGLVRFEVYDVDRADMPPLVRPEEIVH